MRMSKKHNKLNALEREQIAIYLTQGASKREIGRKLGRSDSTIRDEVRRNRFGEHYVAVHAQARWEKTKKEAGSRHPLKNKSVYSYTLRKLRSGWSPEQIAGRLKLKKPGNPYWYISHECIYQFIYARENKHKALWEYLPRKQKKRKQKYGRKAQRSRIPDRVSIHDRPEEIEDRLVFGHWEGDSIEGRAHRGGIHTEVERKTRFLQAILVSGLSSKEAVRAQANIFNSLPKGARKSTTVDNGKEFTDHKSFALPVFFADAYASWQKATNENTNGLIRRYLPKKTDLIKVEQFELDDIVTEINNRPRKCLGFKTPREAFEKELIVIGARIQR